MTRLYETNPRSIRQMAGHRVHRFTLKTVKRRGYKRCARADPVSGTVDWPGTSEDISPPSIDRYNWIAALPEDGGPNYTAAMGIMIRKLTIKLLRHAFGGSRLRRPQNHVLDGGVH